VRALRHGRPPRRRGSRARLRARPREVPRPLPDGRPRRRARAAGARAARRRADGLRAAGRLPRRRRAAAARAALQPDARGRVARVLPPRRAHVRPDRLPEPHLRGRAGDAGRALGDRDALPALRQGGGRRARGGADRARARRGRASRQRPELPGERRARADHEGGPVSSCVCGCCEGAVESTPAPISNLPGLSTLAYRVGTHARFKQTMLVRFSQHDELRALTTREDDDPTIALVDAWASALDVLTFYQERLANEGYLRTAIEQRSVRELARAIGYELGPGVAADTRLAFELETAPGAPKSALLKVGTKVQSVPGQDELPQVFETVEEIEARPEWSSLRARTGVDTLSAGGAVELWVEGIDTGLHAGDLIAFVGKKRLVDSSASDWDVRRVISVEPDAVAGRTRIRWADWLFLGEDYLLGPGASDVEVLAFRVR